MTEAIDVILTVCRVTGGIMASVWAVFLVVCMALEEDSDKALVKETNLEVKSKLRREKALFHRTYNSAVRGIVGNLVLMIIVTIAQYIWF